MNSLTFVASFVLRLMTFIFLILFSQLFPQNNAAYADSSGPLLVVSDSTGGAKASLHEFSRKELDSLPQKVIETRTPWTDGISAFSGPLLRDVIKQATAGGSLLRCRALNDYTIDIPISDGEEYDVILATKRDGKNLSVRDKGPFWIIYPWSDSPELWSETYFGRSIWQLHRIEILE